MAAFEMLKKLNILLPTLLRLGLANVATVAFYRLAIRGGLVAKRTPQGKGYKEPLFHASLDKKALDVPSEISTIELAEELLEGKVPYFSHQKFSVGSPPDWLQNPTNGRKFSNPQQHWSRLSDFGSEIGDIKTVWEASRFDWAIILARAYRLSGNVRFLKALNDWASDWTMKNPLNTGPNWKCGQEASIRLLQVLLSAFLLNQHKSPAPGLVRFVTEHCRRIEPTIRYAMAQDNNHGTSEAAALFVCGAWLEKVSKDIKLKRKAHYWHAQGRRWLENRLNRLVQKDGSFSQHSLNYHRVLVDTLNIVEFWRRELELEGFSSWFYSRSRAAIEWLYRMVDPDSGDAPNLGANDGARLFALSETDYRDYRPSVQLGAVLFLDGKIYPEGPWDEPLFWLELDDRKIDSLSLPRGSRHFSDGGYVVFHPSGQERNHSWGLLRYPNFRFRPGHADGLHFELWHGGINVLRDSGSFSYNSEEPWQSYFASTEAHNTVQFDGRNQMPRLSRFLQGSWLRMDYVGNLVNENGVLSWTGSYKDYTGCSHKRTIIQKGEVWRVIDEVEGYKSCAVLRWRLAPGNWQIIGSRCVGELADLHIESNRPVREPALVEGWESRYYLQKSKLPVLEVLVDSGKAVITTEIHLKS